MLKMAAVGLALDSTTLVVLIVAAMVVVMGVIVTPELVLGVSGKFCGGSGIKPLRLARISATLRRSAVCWLVFGVTDGVHSEEEDLSVVLVALRMVAATIF